MKRFSFLVLAFLLTPALFLHAQTTNPLQDLISSGINIVIYPEIPSPGQQVTATLESTTLDLETSTITWTINGQKIKSGPGLKETSFTMGAAGTKITLQVDINSDSGNVQKTLTLNSSEVDLLWMGRGYTPPFYKGRTLWGAQTQISLVAIPHIVNQSGQEIKPSNLIYKWVKDGLVLGNISGVGKNSLLLTDSVLSLPITVEVQVLTDGDTVVANKIMQFTPQPQELGVYVNSPLYGILFNNQIGDSTVVKDKEFSFSALPFYFSGSSRNSKNLIYSWQPSSPQTGDQSDITYRSPDNNTGSSNISVEVRNPLMVLQSAEKNFKVQFNGDQNL